MKINEINRVGAVNPYRNNSHTKSENSVEKKGKKDELQISPEAQELLNAQAASSVTSRGQKLEELKQSVSSGTYHVDAGKIAEKLMPYLK